MSPREERECAGRAGHRSFSGFLRSLLVGVPWSERAQATETLELFHLLADAALELTAPSLELGFLRLDGIEQRFDPHQGAHPRQ